jgi:hypothetical protein
MRSCTVRLGSRKRKNEEYKKSDSVIVKGNTSGYKNLTQLKLFIGKSERFQATAAVKRRPSFCDITQRGLVVMHRRFGITYRPHFQGSSSPRRASSWTAWTLKMGNMGFAETSLHKYKSMLRKSQKIEDFSNEKALR